MITTTPVGLWFWETTRHEAVQNVAVECARDAFAAWSVLRSVGVAVGAARADICVKGASGSELHCRRGVRIPESGFSDADRVSLVGSGADCVANAEAVTVDLSVPGVCLHNGDEREVGKLFLLSVDVWANGAKTIALRTFADSWMSHDLRGCRQPDVQAENAPRLEAALAGLAQLADAETVPGDPTLYGIPTERGFAALPDEDPDLLDSWYMFEVPRRTDMLRSRIPSGGASLGEAEYDSAVNFMDVVLEGDVIGYLWAAVDESAAGYEPCTPRGDVALDAAVMWLTRLSEAMEGGATPSGALRELAMERDATSFGVVIPNSLKKADSLELVQEMSGRE
ncbi:hypothetical protein [Streptomyces sp. NPDC057381]|uniref:hypothetical protein n=1 Tax=Streptomyces sp. NPDC057381 TaxID=3346111 RepID=UPI003641AC1B